MTRLLRSAMLCQLLPLLAQAAAAPSDVCLMLNNRILGPRTQNRPLPLLAGNETQGFRYACSVAWTKLSPKNEPVAVEACFRGNLLQIATDNACGKQTGTLWVGARWVVTSADLMQPTSRIAMCQQLETGAWAGTRNFSLECATRDATPTSAGKPKIPIKTPNSSTPTNPVPPPHN